MPTATVLLKIIRDTVHYNVLLIVQRYKPYFLVFIMEITPVTDLHRKHQGKSQSAIIRVHGANTLKVVKVAVTVPALSLSHDGENRSVELGTNVSQSFSVFCPMVFLERLL